MTPLPRFRRLFRVDRGASDIERDVDDEIAFHFERTVQDLIAAGRSPDDARREAESRFGDRRAAREQLTDIDRRRFQRERRAEWWESVWQDARFAARSLTRNPGFALAAIMTLGIGIGANTAIFSAVDGVLFRASPFAALDRVAMLWETDRTSGTTREPASIPDFNDFRERARTVTLMAAFTAAEVNLAASNADPERIAGLAVSPEYFATVGVPIMLGRGFTAEENVPGGPRAVIISEELWTRLFQRDPNALGRPVRLNDSEWSVVGVMARGSDFGVLQVLGAAAYGRSFADRGGRPRVDFWAPLRASPDASRDNHPIFVAGRLAPAASMANAQQELAGIAADLERAYPQSNVARGVFVEPMERVVFGGVQTAMLVLLGAVAMVLLVACANVANLLLVRATARSREVVVRTALGAGTRRLAQQFVVEALFLAFAGAAVGVVVAYGAVGVLRSLAPATIPRAESMAVDARALVVTGGIAMIIALVFGMLPTLRAKRLDISGSLQEEGSRGGSASRARRSVRSMLVVAEVAMATSLMIGAGLLIRSLWQLQDVSPGFSAAGVLKAEFQLPVSRYPQDYSKFPNWPERFRFQNEVMARLASQPGVEAVALATANPMDAGFTSSIRVAGREAESHGWPEPSIRTVSASYFGALRVQLVDGRVFESTDIATTPPVVVINAAARDRYFEGHTALGSQILLWGQARTVVGVVGNERIKGLADAAPPAVYLPLDQAPTPSAIFVRMKGDASAAAPLVRRVVREVDPQLALFGVEPLEDTISGTMAQRRYTMLVLSAFAFAAALLAVIGVHGVLSYAVAQRTREIGVRVALGADAGQVRSLVLGDGMRLLGVGLVIGLAGALALSQVMRTLLFGVSAQDPVTFGGVTVLLALVALLASWLPARRASRIDPLIALRAE